MNPTELKHFVAMFNREKKRNVLLVAFSNFIFSLIVFKFDYNHIIHSRNYQ